MLRKPFTSEHIHQTWTPPPSLQGRELAARLKGGVFSICLSVACTFLPDHTLHRNEEGIRGLWNVCWIGWTAV